MIEALLSKVASVLLPGLFSAVDQAVADKDLAAKLKADIQLAVLQIDRTELEAASNLILAEMKGESWAQRNWRPCLMFLIMAQLVFNGMAVPVLAAATGIMLPTVDAWSAIPGPLWDLLMIGMGGYVAGRTLEKVAATVAPSIRWNGPRQAPAAAVSGGRR